MNRGYLLVLSAMMLIGNGFSSGLVYDGIDTNTKYMPSIGYEEDNVSPIKIIKGKTIIKNPKYKQRYNKESCKDINDCKYMSKEKCNNMEDCKYTDKYNINNITFDIDNLSLGNDKKDIKYTNKKHYRNTEDCIEIDGKNEVTSIEVDPFIDNEPSTRIHGRGNPKQRMLLNKNIDLKKAYFDSSSSLGKKDAFCNDKKELDDLFGQDVQEKDYLPNKQDLKKKYAEPSNTIGNQDIEIDDPSDIPEGEETGL